MGGRPAIAAFVIVGGIFVFAGVQTLRGGLQISKEKTIDAQLV
ncbi:MAG: hypothetical protein RIC55_15110 [Pirellulaceae bacterium]